MDTDEHAATLAGGSAPWRPPEARPMALDDLDDEFWQCVEQDGLALSSGEDHMMVASLIAAVGYAEAAARTEEGSDELHTTAGDLQTAMERLQLDVARDRAGALQEHC